MGSRCDRYEPLLSAWIDGELSNDERGRVGGHVAACARCRAEIDTLRATRALLASMPLRRVPEQVVAVSAGRHRRVSRHRAVRRAATRTLAGVGAAVAAVIAIAFAVGGQPSGDRVPVPVEVYVAQHLVRSVGGPVSTPVIVDQPKTGGGAAAGEVSRP